MIGESNGVEQQVRTLPPRSLGDLLNETIIIYGRHFWRFIRLVATVQVPVIAISIAFGVGPVGYAAAQLLGLVAFVIVYAALATAVGQHYALGGVDIRRCYSRVWARVASLTVLYLLIAVVSVTMVALVIATSGIATIIVGPAAVAVMVYGSLTLQSLMMERLKAMAAVARSFRLVSGSWWRVFSVLIVVGLMGLGLGIALNLPFALVTVIGDLRSTTLTAELVQAAGAMIVVVAVSPVVAIAGTLLYCDLRVRKEAYDLSALYREMGVSVTQQAKPAATAS